MRKFDLDLSVHQGCLQMTEINEIVIRNPQTPDPTGINQILEPWVKSTIIVPQDYLGTVITLCIEKGVSKKI